VSSTETQDTAESTDGAETPDAVDVPEEVAEGPQDGASSGPRGRTGIVLVAVGVLLVLVGGLLFYRAHALRNTDGAHNHALTDVAATSRVNGDVSSALAKVFSYTPDGTDATVRAARASLSGRAARQYAQLFARVRADVRDQKVTLSTQTVRVGTVSLRGNTAHLLVFLDQTARRGSKKPTTSAAQLSVTAELRGDVWRIVDLKAR
jgi:Mce-associated membrane protein